MAVVIIFEDSEAIAFDATLQQDHDRSTNVTLHPVEEGADVTDHLRSEPKSFKMSGMIVEFPVTAQGEGPEEEDRPQKAFDKIITAMEDKKLVSIETGLALYENMAIVSANFPRTPDSGFDLVANLEFKEIRKVAAASAAVPAAAIGAPDPNATKPQQKKQRGRTRDQASGKKSGGLRGKIGL